MKKEDKIIEVAAWLCIIAIILFCIRFNYKLTHNVWVIQTYNTPQSIRVWLQDSLDLGGNE